LTWFHLLGISVGLAMDAFAVSLAAGMALDSVTPRHTFRVGFHFGLFQFVMPVLGWFAGSGMVDRIRAYDHWLAFALLALVGGKMLWDARSGDGATFRQRDPTRGWMLVILSVATSIDALAIGLSMALLRVAVWGPAAVIGVVAAAFSALGISLGGRLGARAGQWAEVFGGCILLSIGIRILVAHLAT